MKAIGTNYRSSNPDKQADLVPLKINESRFPYGMRFKEKLYSQGIDENHLHLEWVTQEPFTDDDVEKFVAEVCRAYNENKCTGTLIIDIIDRDGECGPVKKVLDFKGGENG